MVHTVLLARGIPQGVCGELLFKTELENSVFAKWEKYTIGKERRVIFQLPSWYRTQWRIEIILNDYRLTVSMLLSVHTILACVLQIFQDSGAVKVVTSTNMSRL